MIAREVFVVVVNKSTTFTKTRTLGGFFYGGRHKIQIQLQQKQVRETAKFAKTLQQSGAFAKQVDQYCTQCYTRDQLETKTVDRGYFVCSLKSQFCIVYSDSVLGTICKQIRLPTPLGTLCEQRGAAHAQQSEFMKQDVDPDLVPGSSEQRRRMQAVMTVQALDGDVPLGRDRCTMVPCLFSYSGAFVYRLGQWVFSPLRAVRFRYALPSF